MSEAIGHAEKEVSDFPDPHISKVDQNISCACGRILNFTWHSAHIA
jgi:hypothetical protein